jgi:pyruvate/oxaloacetate carboxyltransferase
MRDLAMSAADPDCLLDFMQSFAWVIFHAFRYKMSQKPLQLCVISSLNSHNVIRLSSYRQTVVQHFVAHLITPHHCES